MKGGKRTTNRIPEAPPAESTHTHTKSINKYPHFSHVLSKPKTHQVPTSINRRIRRILRTHPHLERRPTRRPELRCTRLAGHNPPHRNPLIQRRQPHVRFGSSVDLWKHHGFLHPRRLELRRDGVSARVSGVVQTAFEVDFEHRWVPGLEEGGFAERF